MLEYSRSCIDFSISNNNFQFSPLFIYLFLCCHTDCEWVKVSEVLKKNLIIFKI